jgi:cyclomaltodextrinase
MSSFDSAILWQVYPLGFLGAERERTSEVRHRLPALIPWLPYARDLGASVLQLGPIFDSETHGYDTRDHFRIDPRLGDDADFDALIAAADDLGLRVVLDGVFNHVGRRFPRFLAAEADPTSPAARWFRRQGTGWADFEGHSALVSLNHDEPEVADYVSGVMRHWLDRGAAGWRLDAAYAVPASFWARTIGDVRPSHPTAWFAGELLHGDYAAYARAATLDSVTQYELWKAIWSSIRDANLFELDWTLRRHDALVRDVVPLTFVGNHDVTRIASQIPDARHLAHALVVLFTVGGHPSIYSGDEQAFRGVKEQRAGGDDEVRPVFPARPEDLSPIGGGTYGLHQQLIGLRRRSPWLVRASTTVERVENTALVYRSADRDDPSRAIRVVLNLGDAALAAPAGETLAAGGAPSGPVPPHGWRITTA